MKEVPIRFATARIPTQHGEFTAYAYSHQGWEHLVYQFSEVSDPALVRIHSECLTGDTLGSIRCDCGEQLRLSLATIAEAGSGILIYLRGQEGRGIGIGHKIKAYELQDKGHDTVDANLMQGLPADSRDYGVAAQILQDLSVARVRLLTNNPAKNLGLASWGIEIVERLPLEASPNKENIHYLRTKRDRLGHDIQNLEPGEAIS